MYSRRTLPDGTKGSATGEASQSTVPWGLYGGEANRAAKNRKTHRSSGVPLNDSRGKPKAHSTECAFVFQESEMQTHDFFTRMIAMSCVGSNAPNDPTKNGKLKKIYICGACGESHKFESEAEECCQPTVYSQYECPSCSESHETESEAFSCCASFQPKRCPICLKKAQSYEDAADCCLHTHPSMSAAGRDRVAKAVAGGMPWPDAVAANINH